MFFTNDMKKEDLVLHIVSSPVSNIIHDFTVFYEDNLMKITI